MFLKYSTSIMQWILDKGDLGFELTKKFSGNVLVLGGDLLNDNSLQLCDMVLNHSPKCHVYYFNISKVDIQHKIWSNSNIHYIYCDLYHRNGFTDSINYLNRRNFRNYCTKMVIFDIFINLTQYIQSKSENMFLNVVNFQHTFNKCIINPMKAMKYTLHAESPYIVNLSISDQLSSDSSEFAKLYNNIDQSICGNSINQFHDSLSSEISGKCLLILLPSEVILRQVSSDTVNDNIMKCLKRGYSGEYNISSSINIQFIVEQTRRILYDWT